MLLRHLTKPHGIVAVLIVLFVIAWAVWTFYWLPQAEVQGTLEPKPATNGGLPVDPE